MASQLTRLAVAVLILLTLSALSACGGSGGALRQQDGGPQRVTAEWLLEQPGVSAGEYSLHLLDADNQPLPWRGLEVAEDGDGLSLSASGEPPADAYLYVVYPAERLAFSAAELDERVRADYISVAVPGRIERVLALGLARVGGSRERLLGAGPLLRLRFAAGRERTFRAVSAVSDDPANAVTLVLGQATGGTVQLSWEERNLGDYDNNGFVTVSDLTPLGKFLDTPVNGDPELQLIDGDENGQLTVADIGKIGKNFETNIAGYKVKRTPAAEYTIDRDDVFNQTPVALRKQRLQYTFNAPFVPGTLNQYRVVPVDSAGAEGPQSNTVSYDAAENNLPPVWDTTEGIISVTPITGGLRITFGSATDPEGGSVEYVLRYAEAPLAPGSVNATEVVVPSSVTSGSPPYTYDIMGLTAGTQYNLRLQARDEQGLLSSNTSSQSGTVPKLGLSADPWSNYRGNAAATGSNPSASIAGPIDTQWSVDVFEGETDYTVFKPVVAANGRIYVMNDIGDYPYAISPTGSPLASPSPVANSTGIGLALSGNYLISSNNDGVSVFNLGLLSGSLVPTTHKPTDDMILLGDYGVAVAGGALLGILASSATQEWKFGFGQFAFYTRPPVSDGTFIWHANDQNRLVKVDALTGEEVLNRLLPNSLPIYIPPALDTLNGILYLLDGVRLMALNADNLADIGEYPLSGIGANSTITIINHSTPPLVLVTTFDSGTQLGTLHALDASDPSDLQQLWSSSFTQTTRLGVSASADRIYAAQGRNVVPDVNSLRILQFDGTLRQDIATGGQIESEPIPVGDKLYLVVEEELRAYGTATTNLPPTWEGVSAKPGGGIRALSEFNGEVTVEWDYAVDDLGAPVYYAIYWSVNNPPNFDNPGGLTNVITDIPDNGTGSHSFTFDPGTANRVYVGVRAYDAPWGESPQIDSNTNWLAVTPGWERETLLLGTDLPAGEIFFMRGDVRDDGALSLVYNDEASAELTYLFGTTGSWSFEQDGLDTWPTPGFELHETATGPLVGICDDDAAVLTRAAPDVWSRQAVEGSTEPSLNPQISLMTNGADGVLGYTQHIGGAFPDPETHYWSSIFSGGDWQPAVAIDDQNFSGRDIAMVYSDTDPVAIYQLGLTYAFNRLTPQRGLLRMGTWNGTEWDLLILDPGLNTDDNPLTVESDCGKRVRAISEGNLVHLAYLDLDASNTAPTALLKYALLDTENLTINIEVLSTIDLSFQPGSMQFTWGELGFTLVGGEPAISYLLRQSEPSDSAPHFATAWLWDHRDGTSWVQRKLGDSELVYPADREPCVLLADSSDKLHLFYATSSLPSAGAADMLVHVYER